MSTDRKRLTSAIQRIAREDPEIRKLLDDFRNSGGKPSASATSSSGAEDRQICCDGSSSGTPNPGSETRDPSEGGQDGIDTDVPAKLDGMGPGSLVNVTDCATGVPVSFDGADWIPPEGWSSPTNPPIDETYEEGYYWRGGCTEGVGLNFFYSGYESPTESGAISNVTSKCESNNAEPIAAKTLCGSGDGDYCDPSDSDIRLQAWPSDGAINLAIKGGKIVGSKFDPENDGSWSAPRNEVELCDEFGNKFKLTGSASGGWKTINPLNPDDGYLYDSTGKQIARISESEYSDPSV